MKTLVIVGASGDGKVVADIAVQNGYKDIMFLDDNEQIKECLGFPVVGKSSSYLQFAEKCVFFVAIGNPKVRKHILSKMIDSRCDIVSLIHPSAVVAPSVKIGVGSVIMAGAVVNPAAVIGNGCIVNTCASVDHDCIIADYVHISVGAHLAGTVEILEGTWVGIGAVVNNNLQIASECMIGAGAVVVSSIMEKGTYVGVPARKIVK